MIWSRPLDLGAVLANLVISVYFIVGAMLEEKRLLKEFGRQYSDYQHRVSMLVPIKWLAKRVRQAL